MELQSTNPMTGYDKSLSVVGSATNLKPNYVPEHMTRIHSSSESTKTNFHYCSLLHCIDCISCEYMWEL